MSSALAGEESFSDELLGRGDDNWEGRADPGMALTESSESRGRVAEKTVESSNGKLNR